MPAILTVDLGRDLGWSLIGRGPVALFGTIKVVSQWSPLGASLLVLENKLHKLILRHKPDQLAAATQFFDRRSASTTNLIPLYTQFGILLMMAETMHLPTQLIDESQARRALLGDGMTPKGSKNKKAAVMRALQTMGYDVQTDHEADALCVGFLATEKANPARAYEHTPLFAAAATMRQRRARKAA